MTLDTAIVLAAIVLATLWPTHQQLTIRALRHSLRRQHTSLHQQRRAIIQLQTIVTGLPTTSYQPMPTVGGAGVVLRPGESMRVSLASVTPGRPTRVTSGDIDHDPDQTLRLARPPAMTDVAAAITNAGRPLTRAAITEQLGRDARTEIREQLLAGTLTMVRSHDADPAYWPAGDTQRMGRMPVAR